MNKSIFSAKLHAKPAVGRRAFERMFAFFGPRHWWPGETREEIIIGAVLTQNTNWKNVEKAIENLKRADALDFHRMAALKPAALAELIRPAGYYNIKAGRLQSVCHYFIQRCGGDLDRLEEVDDATLRSELLATHGVGRETADSILLYALERPVFVIDAYTLRIGARHGWFPEGTKYEEARSFFERSVRRDVALYNEYHALLVAVGNRYCKPKPACAGCPLNEDAETRRRE
ncbi:MAG: endonuclease III domain-containing protein, partial [Candidatus Sumerlaeota bacterium]|nr:endonuclease III domain-containing protein [Candidatus Sumerlaeota bacterium]